MKNIIFLSLLSILSLTAFSQEEKKEMKTLFKNSNGGKIEHGFYGGFHLGYSYINSENAIIGGIRGAWIIDHHLAIGLRGQGFSNSINKYEDKENGSLSGGYGGFFIAPIIAPNSPIHVSFPIFFGFGGASLKTDSFWSVNEYEFDSYVVFEPGIDVDLNIVKILRISFGASYRLTNGVVFENIRTKDAPPKNAIDGVNFLVSFKFGKF